MHFLVVAIVESSNNSVLANGDRRGKRSSLLQSAVFVCSRSSAHNVRASGLSNALTDERQDNVKIQDITSIYACP